MKIGDTEIDAFQYSILRAVELKDKTTMRGITKFLKSVGFAEAENGAVWEAVKVLRPKGLIAFECLGRRRYQFHLPESAKQKLSRSREDAE